MEPEIPMELWLVSIREQLQGKECLGFQRARGQCEGADLNTSDSWERAIEWIILGYQMLRLFAVNILVVGR